MSKLRTTVVLDEVEKVFVRIVSNKSGLSLRRIMREALWSVAEKKWPEEWEEAKEVVEKMKEKARKKAEMRKKKDKRKDQVKFIVN